MSTLRVKGAVFASDSNIKTTRFQHGRTWDDLGFRSEVNVLGSCRRIPGLAFKVFGQGKSLGTDDLNPQKKL